MYHHHKTHQFILTHSLAITWKNTPFFKKKNYSADVKTILVTSGTTTNTNITFLITPVQENTNELK